jgi:tRNA(Glu) U13 pseudouridine synthase TruD
MKLYLLPVNKQVKLIEAMKRELVKFVNSKERVTVNEACQHVANVFKIPRSEVRYALTAATTQKCVIVDRQSSTLHKNK